jgi:hypothetical protein
MVFLPSDKMECMSVREMLAERRDEVLAVARRHGAVQLRVIGSVAHGAERPDSDIDFLVTWEPWTSLLDCSALILELEKMLERKVDIASDGWVRPELREGVYRTPGPCDRAGMRSDRAACGTFFGPSTTPKDLKMPAKIVFSGTISCRSGCSTTY